MTTPSVLVIDDQEAILANFATLLDPRQDDVAATLDELALALGDASTPQATSQAIRYQMSYARQGSEGVERCRAAKHAGTPFSVAFVDIHMPPGIDGVQTAVELWNIQPDLEIVLCTAHSVYTWQEILDRVPRRDQLVILRKPFDPIEVRQLAACLTDKAARGRALAKQMEHLEARIASEVARRLELELGALQKFEALGRLAAGVAHEINTPMQYIQSSLEYLGDALDQSGLRDLQPELTNEMHLSVSDALDGVARVAAIVRSVGEYAHVQRRQHATPVDVNRQIQMAAQLGRAEYKRAAELVLDLGELPPVEGYADELGRAILNLLINASHAITAKGGRGQITISTRALADGVRLSVADTGIGIPPEHRSHIFEPFFTTKELGKGTGQGLAIVRKTIVEQHAGRIEVESVVGQGTTFHLFIPRDSRGVAA